MRKRVLAVIAVLVVGARGDLGAPAASSVTPEASRQDAGSAAPHDRARPERDRGEDRAAPAVLVDDDPKGSLRLEGQVVDADDHPVAGATVVLGANPPAPPRPRPTAGSRSTRWSGAPTRWSRARKQGIAGPDDRAADREERSGRAAPAARREGRPSRWSTATASRSTARPSSCAAPTTRAQTTKAGKTTFDAVVPGGYQVAAWADGLARSLTWLQVGDGEHAVKLILMPGAPVAGRVVDDKGRGVAGARVTFHGASDWSQQADARYDAALTGADGSFGSRRCRRAASGSRRRTPSTRAGSTSMVTLDGKHEQTGVRSRSARAPRCAAPSSMRPASRSRARACGSARRARRGMIFEPPRQAYSDGNGAFELTGCRATSSPRSRCTRPARRRTRPSTRRTATSIMSARHRHDRHDRRCRRRSAGPARSRASRSPPARTSTTRAAWATSRTSACAAFRRI